MEQKFENPRRPRRRRKRSKRNKRRGGKTGGTPKILRNVIDNMYRKIHMGKSGAYFLENVVDPFGQESGRGPKFVPFVFPDGEENDRIACTETITCMFEGSTATSGVIQVRTPDVAVQCSRIAIHHGTDATDLTNSPNATVEYKSAENSFVTDMISANSRIRIIHTAIRVKDHSSDDVPKVMTRAYDSTKDCETANGVWGTYGSGVTHVIENDAYRNGLTCRSRIPAKCRWSTIRADEWDVQDEDFVNVGVVFTNLHNTDGQLLIQATVRYEIDLHETPTLPIQVIPHGYEKDMAAIIHLANSHDRVVSADSFKSFLRNFGKGLTKAVHFVEQHPDVITSFLKVLTAV